ncbi:MAG: sulfatase-like hydrolase/transferase [Spirochaetaceae bacterium]
MKSKPNVLLLFSDQHQAACMSSENHPDVSTPNLDNLAKGGIKFNRAYCQDAICTPSRISMITGVHPRGLGVFDNDEIPSIVKDTVPLSEYFSKKGYETAAFGKRHLCPEVETGWDIKKSHMAAEGDEFNYVRWIKEQGLLEEFTNDWSAEFGHGPDRSSTFEKEIPYADFSFRISQLPDDKTMEAYTAKETIQFLKDNKKSDKPFFCWSSFYRPHQPYTPLQKYFDMYSSKSWGSGKKDSLDNNRPFDGIKRPASMPTDFDEIKKTLPPLLRSQYEGENRVWCINKAMKNEQLYRDYLAAYYGLVTEIDAHIGSIVKTLKDEGLYENTIIIYTADHGDFVGRHGMIEKCAPGHNVYEETLRIPFIVHYPKELASGVVSEALVELADLYPSLSELVDGEIPNYEIPLSGQSLVPLMRPNSKTSSLRDFTVSLNRSQATVVTDRYKLGIWLDPGVGRKDIDFRDFGNMMFDRIEDPLELNNLYGDKKYSEIQQKLHAFYKEWEESYKNEK